MEKIKLELVQRDFITKSFAGQEIKIVPYIELSDVDAIIEGILNMIIEEKEQLEQLTNVDKIVCFTRVNNYILDNYTNIDISAIDVDILTTSGLEEYVFKFIANYSMLKELLLQSMIEYNQTLILINMMNALPNANELTDETGKLAEQLNLIDEKKLKLVTGGMVEELAKKSIDNEKKTTDIIDKLPKS